ncbi:methyl-accepting chemotaxis protein [Butyrivibrio proteoclasticus]|uniref:Methyl-accepting chemotaxis protein n=1 Tax=Butyrivibrio proteoclasticus TaxID=43305 RepID=A0A1I5XJN9_9FIRM|nr:HAMP domain-containing methyl-accepting chemotaxis protein [Butyrivibrio proteoclasticus]SFQ32144.1 methyl-accepting chemotaxis protein [Butyrivibrio proteoclasticus]
MAKQASTNNVFSSSSFKKLSVSDKFKKVFSKFQTNLIAIFVVIILIDIVAIFNLHNIYAVYYEQNTQQGEVRTTIQALAKYYLWALAAQDADDRNAQIAGAQEKIQELHDGLDTLGKVYKGDLETIRQHINNIDSSDDTLIQMLSNGSSTQELYDFYGNNVNEAIKVVVKDFKEVGNSAKAQAASAYSLAIISVIAMTLVSLIVVIYAILYSQKARRSLTSSILEPISAITEAADRMAKGEIEIKVKTNSEDELGKLACDITAATDAIADIVKDIAETLTRMSSGDFTAGSKNEKLYIGDYDAIRKALADISNNLSSTLAEVKNSSQQVSQGAVNMSQGANDLAEGSTDQAAAVEELTASVNSITEQTRQLADVAEKSKEMATEVRDNAEASARKMHLVTDAMTRITEASAEIEQVTNSIEAIAKQTSLLALNASIEAARAGETGKGFAVVADQIGKLADESSEAAKNTHQLIADTMDEIKNGNSVVAETTEALDAMQHSVEDITEMIIQTGDLANQQAQSMDEIDKGIEMISNVVQSNSATAEESSAVSQELSEQSESLNDLIRQFRINE